MTNFSLVSLLILLSKSVYPTVSLKNLISVAFFFCALKSRRQRVRGCYMLTERFKQSVWEINYVLITSLNLINLYPLQTENR